MYISKFYQTTFVAAAMVVLVSTQLANADPGERGGKRGGPPQEAFDACVGKAEGDVCAFSGNRGDAEGTCINPPRGEDVLVCAPERGQRGRRGGDGDAQ